MKKFLFSIFCCMLAVFSAQAEEVTLSYSDVVGQGTSGGGGGFECSVSDINFNFSNAYGNSAHIKAYGGCEITLSGATITNVVITATTSSYIKTWDASEGDVTVSGTTATWTGSSTELVLTNTASAQARITSIVVTYTTAGEGEGGGGEEPETPTAEEPAFNPESCEFNIGESVTVEITAAEGATIYYTTDGETPTENSNVYETALTITETTTVKAIAVIDGHNNSAVAEATYTAIDPNAVEKTIVASEAGIANGIAVETLKFGNVTATFDQGSNSNGTKYYASGTAFRAYGGNTITFTGDAGVVINSVIFTFGNSDGSNAITADCGTYSEGTWTGASDQVIFTIGGTSGNRRLAKITVIYSIQEGVVVIPTPTINGEATFVGSTTVEIVNNADGTTLYYSTDGYSTDGENYNVYENAFTIDATTTVYAYAMDAEGNKSAVAEAVFTELQLLSIAEAKAAYDAAGANVDVAMDITGAVVTVNSGQYMFIETEDAGINLYNSGANYAVGTKFTKGYILGQSTAYGKMHQVTSAEFNNVQTTTVEVVPTEVTVADLNAEFDAYEGRLVRLTGVDVNDKNIAQGEDAFALYNRFDFITAPTVATDCNIEGIVARYNTTLQIFPTSFSNTLNVTEAGYATLYLAYPVAIPAEVEAYVATTVNGAWLTLEQVTGVLPANTGVIVKADNDEYDFVYSAGEAATITANLLSGSAADEDVAAEAYVLGNVDGVVGLYKAAMNNGVFRNNANKAYLPASTAQGAASLSFRFGEGATGIESVAAQNGANVIFDITGRKVETINAAGIYIVNGKKVLVK